MTSFDTTPLTGDTSWLEAYGEARASTRWVEACAACPVHFHGLGVYRRCCKWPEPQPKRTFLQRLKARFGR